MKAYLVGGCVRDRLLGLPVRDRDWVVVGATPDVMSARGFHRVGKGFPVYLHPETGEEYALARIGWGEHAAFHPATSLEDDLRHRDFTINALAEDGDRLIDPTGGRADLAARLIRHNPGSLEDDPVRMLRAARLAAQLDGFAIAAETLTEMGRLAGCGALDQARPIGARGRPLSAGRDLAARLGRCRRRHRPRPDRGGPYSGTELGRHPVPAPGRGGPYRAVAPGEECMARPITRHGCWPMPMAMQEKASSLERSVIWGALVTLRLAR